MKTTLLVENNAELESFYSLNLQTWVGTTILPKKEAKFCHKLLSEQGNTIDLIITKSRNGLEKSAEALHKMLIDLELDIPIVVIGRSTIENSANITHLNSGLDIKSLIQTTAKFLGVTAKDMARQAVPDYFAIPINYFLSLRRSVTNVFEESIDKPGVYLKKMDEFQEFDPSLIKTYIQQGVANLYVLKEDRLKFVTNVTQELITKIEESDLNEDEQLTASEMGQKLLAQKLNRIGITEETTALATKQLKSMASTCQKFPKIKKLLNKLIKNKTGYLFMHSQLLTFICTHLMTNIDWGNEEQIKKINFIAFFHDITLETDEQAAIHSEKDLKASKMSQEAKALVNTHAQRAAELIAKYPHAPMGSDVIIRQHHGIVHGVGFSTTYGGNLSPMTIVFILAEDLVDHIIKSGSQLNMEKIIDEMREKYPTQRFQKIIDIMETISI